MKEALSMSSQTIFGDTLNATSSPVLEGGVMHSDSQDGRTLVQSGQEAVPASLLASPAIESELLIRDICGLDGSPSSASAALQSYLENRLRTRLPKDGWTELRTIWKHKVTPSLRRVFQLAVSVPRIEGIASGLWRTPGAQDGERGCYASRDTMENRLNRGGQLSLPNQVKHPYLWPTPRANKVEGYPSNRFRPTLAQMVTGGAKPLHGALNPEWVAWLMGYPIEWASCADSVTPLFLRSRRSS